MSSEFQKDPGLEAERRRSRSGASSPDAPPDTPPPEHDDAEDLEEDDEKASRFPQEPRGEEGATDGPPPCDALEEGAVKAEELGLGVPWGSPRRRTRRLVKPDLPRAPLGPEQRLLFLDVWRRSGLPARDFAALVGVSKHTLYAWKKRFDRDGPAGLVDKPKGAPRGSRVDDLTRRAILLMKQSHPDWGTERISGMLLRGPALSASPAAVARVLHEAGYELEEVPTRAHSSPEPRRFERARANQLWQTDLFTFVLKRQNRRVYLVVFLDDHSRFVVGYGLGGTQSTALVVETLRSAVVSYRSPEEILTDNGPQYVTWRGKSTFSRELERRGIRHVVSRVKHPQTLGKVERFWGTLWRELVEGAVFLDLADAQRRVGLWLDYYNFQRVHTGIGGLVPADRYFGAAEEVLKTLKERVQANAQELARDGLPRSPFYLTGSAGGRAFSVHAEGERVILRRAGGEREEVELVGPEEGEEQEEREEEATGEEELPEPLCPSWTGEEPGLGDEPPPPGVSPVDQLLEAPQRPGAQEEEPEEPGSGSAEVKPEEGGDA